MVYTISLQPTFYYQPHLKITALFENKIEQRYSLEIAQIVKKRTGAVNIKGWLFLVICMDIDIINRTSNLHDIHFP